GEPREEISELETLQLEGFSHRYLCESLKVGALHADREEHELLGLLAFLDPRRCFPPIVGRTAIGDEENPRTVVSNTVRPICALALLDHVEALNYGRAHRRIPMRTKDRSLEHIRSLKVVDDGNRSEAHNPDLYALCREGITHKLFLEDCEASVEL